MIDIDNIIKTLENNKIDKAIFGLIENLFPICRSITGDGVRSTLSELKKYIPLETFEVKTGTKVFDWKVPKEWNIKDAYIMDKTGKKIVDFKNSNLHVLNYSIPIDETLTLSEIKGHLHTLPDYPDWIPYKTSYYKEEWGFCLTHNQFLELKDDEYHVFIDSTLTEGALSFGEFYLPGKVQDEVLFSCHICHPSLCNDNLSGISVLTFLAQLLSNLSLNYSYRFLFIPGTIGAITWLSLNEKQVDKIKYGLVLSCIGDSGNFTYKKSRIGNADIDKIVSTILNQTQADFTIKNFIPYGYDERQFCSPGFNLPVGSLSRSAYGTFNEYHTSADNLDFVKKDKLIESLKECLKIIQAIEMNKYYMNTNPKCEPQLGSRGLYAALGGHKDSKQREMAMFWILNYSDGNHSLVDISAMSKIDFNLIAKTALKLEAHNLLNEVV